MKIYGAKDKAELMGSLDKIFIPETFEKFGDQLAAMFEGHPYFETEFVMHDIQGDTVYALGALRLPNNISQAKRVVVSLLNITDRKKTEEKVLNLAKFPSENPNPVLRIDKSGKVIYSNQAGVIQLKKLGLNIGRKAPKVLYDVVTRLFKEKSYKPETLNVEIGKSIYEFVITPVKDTGYTNLYGRDISDRIKAENEIKKYSENLEEMVEERTKGLETLDKELVKSEKKYRELFESNRDGISLVDMDGYFIDTNQAFRDMVGYSADELKKLTYFDLTPQKWHKMNEDIVKNQILARGRSDEFEKEYIKKNGEVFPIIVQTWLIKNKKGKPAGFWGIIRDLTQIKKLQLELIRNEKLAILGQLAGGVGHELRNPLAAIKNASYFLNMSIGAKDDDLKETLDIIDSEVNRSDKIISDLLDFSKTRQITIQKVNIGNIIERSLKSVSIPVNIKTVVRLEKKMPQLMADSGQLVQIFSNIILNAIQAMHEGGKLTIRSKTPDNKWAEISVSDTGVGIPEKELDEIFEPLFTTKAKGIGLGMAITKILVDAHGGRIRLKSKVGIGTTFTVSLPFKIKR